MRYEVVDPVAARLDAVPRANLLRRVAEMERSVQAGTLPQRVRELGEWIVDCATATDFLARVEGSRP